MQLVHRLHNQRFVSEKYLVVCLVQIVNESIHGKISRIRTKLAACIIVCPYVEADNLAFISSDRAINWNV